MLNSRLLHKTVSQLMPSVTWLDGTLNDWKLFGRGKDLNIEFIKTSIRDHFKTDKLYLIDQRTNSKAYKLTELEPVIIEKLGESDITIWNLELDRVIEFNSIGVLRLGKLERISRDKKETFSYFDAMGASFPEIKSELEDEELDMTFSKMEIFATYSNTQITKGDADELSRCFRFQESHYDSMNSLLLNALSVSYCEALLLGENSAKMNEIKSIMPPKLKEHFANYEKFYEDLSTGASNE